MPQRNPRQARPRGYDSTVSIATASSAKTILNNENQNLQTLTTPPGTSQQESNQGQGQGQGQKANDDLKKLIETLKNKLGSNTNTTPQKKVPPSPESRTAWNRSLLGREKTWAPKPAYTILTRISNHEKVPVRSIKQAEITVNSIPHSFLYRPGADGIKVDKLSIKAGKQVGWG